MLCPHTDMQDQTLDHSFSCVHTLPDSCHKGIIFVKFRKLHVLLIALMLGLVSKTNVKNMCNQVYPWVDFQSLKETDNW